MDLLFPLLIIFMIGMIFFSSRQRKKQQQQTEEMQNAIGVGDVVLMTSGISGTVVDTDDERTIDLEIAPDVITTWLRAAVREKLSSDSDTVHADDAEPTLDDHADAPHDAVETGVAHGASSNGTPANGIPANGTPGNGAAANGSATRGTTTAAASSRTSDAYGDATAEPRTP